MLARKYRPRTFADVVGQEPVVRALANALDNERLHHAYLFTGTRGVGKTTLARILAACLNCETGVTSKPCGECGVCDAIAAGRFLDLVEVDAASRTGVDDTRELLSNAQFLPAQGRYKVYLIDEVHMLTGHSFNALLKTLEEPPQHVKFLLATTEAKKIPATVLSRCLQFNLKNISPRVIEKQLAKVLEAERIAAEPAALGVIAQAAAGSMRDALSITDQAVSHGGGSVDAANVTDMLGIAGRDEIGTLLDALVAKDGPQLLAAGDDLAGRALDLAAVLGELQRALHALAVAAELRIAPEAPYERFAQAFSPEDLQLYYQIALMGARDIEFAPDAKVGFDMALIRLASFEPARPDAAQGTPPAPPAPAPAREPPTGPATPAPQKATAAPGTQAAQATRAPTGVPNPTGAPNSSARTDDDWHVLVERMAPEGVTAMLLNNANLADRSPTEWTILLAEDHESLLNDKQRTEIAGLVSRLEGHETAVRFQFGEPAAETPAARAARLRAEEQVRARELAGGDAGVQALVREFGARVVEARLES